MALKTFVKVSGINNLSDARYCAGMEVDQLGFEIEEGSDNYVDSQSFNEIKGWLSGVQFVGEISSTTANITECIKAYDLDAIQIQNIKQIQEASKTGLKVIFLATSLELANEVADNYSDKIDYLILENDVKPTDREELSNKVSVVLLSGFNSENVVEVSKTNLKGVSIRGGKEIRPGYKDFDEMADILEALEIDDLADE